MENPYSGVLGLPIEWVSWFTRTEEASTRIEPNKDEASSTLLPKKTYLKTCMEPRRTEGAVPLRFVTLTKPRYEPRVWCAS